MSNNRNKCESCWQYKECDPPKGVNGCEFYSPTQPTESEAFVKVCGDIFEKRIDPNEPAGLCGICGVNIYLDDLDGICEQCVGAIEYLISSNGYRR
jgi:hypothetical protein